MKRILICLLLFINLICSNLYAYIEPDFNLNAKETLIYNIDSDTIVYEKEADKQIAPASLTKIMTFLVVIKNEFELSDTVVITKEMLAGLREANASVMGLVIGEKITIKDLLYGLLMSSGADAARALAIYTSSTEEAFINEMNAEAHQLGMENTHFENPIGLDSEYHYTTARDLLTLMQEAYKYDLFREIVTSNTYTTKPTNKHSKGFTLKTGNPMKNPKHLYYSPFVMGGKTGYTGKAGRCYGSFGKTSNGNTYIVISMGVKNTGSYENARSFEDAKRIYEWLDQNFYLMQVKQAGERIGELPIIHAKEKVVEIVYSEDVNYLADSTTTQEQFTFIERPYSNLTAPIEQKGEVVGEIDIYYLDEHIATVSMLANSTIEYNLMVHIKENIQLFMNLYGWKIVGIGITFVIFLWMLRAYKIRKYRKRRMLRKINK